MSQSTKQIRLILPTALIVCGSHKGGLSWFATGIDMNPETYKLGSLEDPGR